MATNQDPNKVSANTISEVLLKEILKALVEQNMPGYAPAIGYSTALRQDAQTSLLEKLVGFEIPAYDYLALTYVTVGNGIGEIETVTYKTGGVSGTTVAVLTLAYDVNNNVISVTKS